MIEGSMGKEKYRVYRTVCPLKPYAASRNSDGHSSLFVLPHHFVFLLLHSKVLSFSFLLTSPVTVINFMGSVSLRN